MTRVRWSDDPKEPLRRLALDFDDGILEIREEQAARRFDKRTDAEVFERLVLTRAEARWLRDELRRLKLDDAPGRKLSVAERLAEFRAAAGKTKASP